VDERLEEHHPERRWPLVACRRVHLRECVCVCVSERERERTRERESEKARESAREERRWPKVACCRVHLEERKRGRE